MSTIEVFRHDERMDFVEHERANIDRVYDCPLSTGGVAHAVEVARAVANADLVVSSPLLRCVQTAIPWTKGVLILDARLMEVYNPKVIGPLHEFKFRTNDELPPAFYIRTIHGIPEKEERRGINGEADFRFRAVIQEYAEQAHRSGMKHVQLFTHGDAIGSFAQMLGKEVYSTDFGSSLTAIYDGSWKYVRHNNVGIF
jgi:broad specificity phosphatase PhoE